MSVLFHGGVEAQPERHHQQDRRHVAQIDQLIDRFSRRRIAPVDVLETRSRGLDSANERIHSSRASMKVLRSASDAPLVAVSAGASLDGEPGGEDGEQLFGARPERNERSAELCRARHACVGVLEPGGRAPPCARTDAAACSGGSSNSAPRGRSRRAHPLPELVHDPALADPRLTRDQHRLTRPSAGVTPPPLEPARARASDPRTA